MSKPTDLNSKNPLTPVIVTAHPESSSQTPIQLLPDELMMEILSCLGAQGLAACSSVCKHWHGLSQDPSLWRRLFNSTFPNCNHKEMDDFQKAYRRHHPNPNVIDRVYATHTLPRPVSYCSSSAVNDGLFFLSSHDDTIKIWDLEKQQCVRTLNPSYRGSLDLGTYCGAHSLAFVNGKLYSAHDGTIGIWDLEKYQYLGALNSDHHSNSSLAVVDGKLCSGSISDGTIEIWDLEKRQCVCTLTGSQKAISCLAAVDGKLYSGSDGGVIEIWDLEKRQCVGALTGTNGRITSLIAIDGKLFSGSEDRRIKIWDLETRQSIGSFAGHDGVCFFLGVIDGKLCSNGADGTIKIWDIKTYQCLCTFPAVRDYASQDSINPQLYAIIDGKFVLASNEAITIVDFKAANDEVFEEIADLFTRINCLT